jgi:hypothetical protein
MLAKDPAHRPPADATRALLHSVAVGGTPSVPADTARPAQRRHRGLWLAAAAVALVAVPAVFPLHGKKDAPDPSPSPAPVDPVRGRFTAAPQPCSLISADGGRTPRRPILPSTADAAFVYDATDGLGSGRTSTVWLRSSNVVLKVVFADHLDSTDATRIHQNAIEAAGTVATHL